MTINSIRPTAVDPVPFPPLRAAWAALVLLLLAYTCSFIDRQILSLLVQPIRADLNISDTQLSLLQGISFAFFYSLLGIPFGVVADRWHRRNLIIGGLIAWSLATAWCGLANSFAGMFLARMAVGVGEACLAPAAYSLISDSFGPEQRGRALSIYSSGSYVGAGLALIAGGGVIAVSGDAAAILQSIGIVRSPWQTVFIVVSLFGIVLAPFLLLIREPYRRGRLAERPTVAQGLRVFSVRARYYISLVLALSFIAIVNYSFFAWTPTMFERRYGWQPQEIGPLFGIILAVLGPAGTAIGGFIVDKVRSAPSDRMAALLCVVSTSLALPFALLATLSATPTPAVIGLCGIVLLIAIPVAMGPFIVQTTTPNEFRGVAISAYMLIVNIIGLGAGPLSVALISDHFLRDDRMIGQSIAILSVVGLPIAAALFVTAWRAVARNGGRVDFAESASTSRL
jgi:MFS family permease